MSRLAIRKLSSIEDRTLPIFAEIDEIAERIRARAFELFAENGFLEGRDVEDWLAAEQEICWSVSELIEESDKFILKIALAGFEPDEIDLTANPREIIIKAAHSTEIEEPDEKDGSDVRWSEFRNDDIYRRVELPVDIRVEDITAELKRGLLTIEAPKAETEKQEPKRVKIITTA